MKVKLKAHMVYLKEMLADEVLRYPGTFELLGVEYLLDDDLNFWLLEVVRSPGIQNSTDSLEQRNVDMLREMILLK